MISSIDATRTDAACRQTLLRSRYVVVLSSELLPYAGQRSHQHEWQVRRRIRQCNGIGPINLVPSVARRSLVEVSLSGRTATPSATSARWWVRRSPWKRLGRRDSWRGACGCRPISSGAAGGRRGGATLFLQLVSARHKWASTVLTSNKSFAEWRGVLADGIPLSGGLRPPTSTAQRWVPFRNSPDSSAMPAVDLPRGLRHLFD